MVSGRAGSCAIDLESQPPTWPQNLPTLIEQPQRGVQSVIPAFQREGRLPAPYRWVQARILGSCKIRRIGDQRVEAVRFESRTKIAANQLHPPTHQPAVLPRQSKRLGGAVDSHDISEATFQREAQRDASTPSPDIRDSTTTGSLEQQLNQALSLRARNERAPIASKPEVPEAGPAGHMIERLARCMTLNRLLVVPGTRGIHTEIGIQQRRRRAHPVELSPDPERLAPWIG